MRDKLSTTTLNRLKPAEKPFEVVDTEIKGYLLRVQPSGRMTYYYSYRNSEGKKVRIKLGVVGSISVKQAREQAVSVAGKASDGIDVQKEKKIRRNEAKDTLKTTLGYFITTNYGPWALANRKSGQDTLDTLKRHFSDWYDLQLSEIGVLMLENWRTSRLDDGKQPTTINRNVAALKAVLSKAEEWGAIDYHPLGRLKPLRIDNSPKVRYLSPSEESALITALKERDSELRQARERGNQFRVKRGYTPLPSLMALPFADYLEPMVTLSLKTGMRRGEIFDLLWSDVDFDRAVFTIRAAISKSNRTRYIPMSPTALETLKKWRGQHEDAALSARVFTNSKGERFDNTNKAWRSLLKDAGIAQFRWHDMRHDFASKLVMKGVPLNTVRELCGHTDMNTTLRYAHLAPEHKAEAIAVLG